VVQKLMRSSRRGLDGCNRHAGQGPMDEGTTRQWDDERADELLGDGAALARTGVEVAGDGFCEHDKAMMYGYDMKMEEERGQQPRSPRRCSCGGGLGCSMTCS
jgi:hypothetical protein